MDAGQLPPPQWKDPPEVDPAPRETEPKIETTSRGVSREEHEHAGAQLLVPNVEPRSTDPTPWWQVRGHSHAAETAKLDARSAAFQTYLDGMAQNTEGKAEFFARHIRALGRRPLKIIDIGASGGELVKRLELRFPQHFFTMVDLSPDAMKRGGAANGRAAAADAFYLPYAAETVHVAMMSSFFHELYSYAPEPFSKEYTEQGLFEVKRVLLPGGKLMIRDPARPENPDEPMTIRPSRENGTNPTTREELLASDPSALSTGSLLERFLIEFPPAQHLDPGERLGKGEQIEVPAWVASEFIRHRVFARDIDLWSSELRELYGVCTKRELAELARRTGFELDRVETSFNPKNRSAGYENEMRIFSADGREVKQAERFPTQILAILTKPE